MRNLATLATAALLAVGLAMFGVHSAADAGSGATVTKKMKGSFSAPTLLSGTDHFSELDCGGAPYAHGESTATGNVRHLGLTEVYTDASWDWSVYTAMDRHADMLLALGAYTFCSSGETPTNEITFTAANGDEIFADITSGRVNELCSGAGFEILIGYTITDGTGRFTGATGGGEGITRINFVEGCEGEPNGFLFSEFEGTVTY